MPLHDGGKVFAKILNIRYNRKFLQRIRKETFASYIRLMYVRPLAYVRLLCNLRFNSSLLLQQRVKR